MLFPDTQRWSEDIRYWAWRELTQGKTVVRAIKLALGDEVEESEADNGRLASGRRPSFARAVHLVQADTSMDCMNVPSSILVFALKAINRDPIAKQPSNEWSCPLQHLTRIRNWLRIDARR